MNEEQRKQKEAELAACERFAEEAYDAMYEAHSSSDATGRYSDAKEAFYDAIRAARKLGLKGEVRRLEARLEHVKSVFRSQFS
jgi:7-cyano-7-deazaguanine synthase in queuosine biosynthesis